MGRDPLAVLLEKLSPELKAKVGDYLMGGDDGLMKLQTKALGIKTADEKDTAWEAKLYDTLSTWVRSSDNPTAKQLVKLKSDLDKLKKEFPPILQPPLGQLVYRGSKIKAESLIPTLRKSVSFNLVRLYGAQWVHLPKVPYSPYRPAQSWSTDKQLSSTFSNTIHLGSNKSIGVIYLSKITKDFIMNPAALAAIYGQDEREVIRIAKQGTFPALMECVDLIDLTMVHHFPKSKPFFDRELEVFNRKYNFNRKNKKNYTWDDLRSANGGLKRFGFLVEQPWDYYERAAVGFFRSSK